MSATQEKLRDRAKKALREYDGELTNMENFTRAELRKAAEPQTKQLASQ